MPRKTKIANPNPAPVDTPVDAPIDMPEEPETPVAELVSAKTPTPQPEEKMFDEVGELVVDVYETSANFVVLAAIAGVQIKDLDISLEKEMMIIKGNRCDPHEHHDKKYFYQECYWGPFSRKVILPENIDLDKADAQIDKGILTIKIPKNAAGNGKSNVKIS